MQLGRPRAGPLLWASLISLRFGGIVFWCEGVELMECGGLPGHCMGFLFLGCTVSMLTAYLPKTGRTSRVQVGV